MYVCVYAIQLYISTRVYYTVYYTCSASWLIFHGAELGSTHLDPWLEKLTCERALTGSTLPAEKSNLFFFFRFEPNLSGKLPRPCVSILGI